MPRASVPSPRLDAVVWDYDGTLVATRAADEEAVREIVAGDPSLAAGVEAFWATEGQPLLQRLELAWPGRAREMLPLFSRRVPPRCFAGVGPVTAEIRRRGLRQAVVSSRRRDTLEWGLRACGLRDRFDGVVGLEDVHAPKPDPEGLLLVLRALEVAAACAVYIGDSDIDVEAGRRAGMAAWRATWASSPDAPGGPFTVRRPAEVLDRLQADQLAAG